MSDASNICNCPAPPIEPTLANVCGGGQFLLFMGLLETLLRTQCDIEDPCQRPQTIDEPLDQYDFIVVGSGCGGSVMAARLSEIAAWRVLLIEWGGHQPTGLQVPAFYPLYFGHLHFYDTEPNHRSYLGSPGNRSAWMTAHMFGGNSAINGMTYMRGNRQDYDGWQRMGNAGWSYADVLPYFRKAEDLQETSDPTVVIDRELHGTGGPQPVTPVTLDTDDVMVQAVLELGWQRTDLNGHNPIGFDAITCTRSNQRSSAARSYLWPVANRRPNLDIWLQARATRVLLEGPRGGRRAVGVEVQSGGRTWRVRASREVIVSAGAVESAKLLLLSGIGRAKDLRRVGVESSVELPGVGQNMQNHIGLYMQLQRPLENRYHLNWEMAAEYLTRRTGPLGVPNRSFNAKLAGRYATDPRVPDLQIEIGTEFPELADRCSRTGATDDRPVARSLASIAIGMVLKPLSRGSISLNSADPLQPPRIYPNDLGDEMDVEKLVDCMKITVRVLETRAARAAQVHEAPLPAGSAACKRFEVGSDAYWRCRVRHGAMEVWHPVGTCSMARRPGDPMAVVDERLRVRGVRGLRVVDGSVMPEIVSGNTMATIVMLAEKTADAVKWEHGEL